MKRVDPYQRSMRDMAREKGVPCGERTTGWWVVVVVVVVKGWVRRGAVAKDTTSTCTSRPEFLNGTRTQTL